MNNSCDDQPFLIISLFPTSNKIPFNPSTPHFFIMLPLALVHRLIFCIDPQIENSQTYAEFQTCRNLTFLTTGQRILGGEEGHRVAQHSGPFVEATNMMV